MVPWTLSGTTQVIRYQKYKTNLDLLEEEIVSGNGISWAICKSAPRPSSSSSFQVGQGAYLIAP